MSSGKTAAESKVHTSLRFHATPKQPLLECEQCYYQHNNHHPCLFCKGCLKSARNKPKHPAVNTRNGYHGSHANKSYLDGPVEDGKLDTLKSGKQSVEFWEAFMELKTDQKQRLRTSSDERVTEQRTSIMKQKAKKLEKRATRCGYCPSGAKITQLVSFCVHCKKHLCGICSKAHASDPLCKHHGTVDLSKGKNTALL